MFKMLPYTAEALKSWCEGKFPNVLAALGLILTYYKVERGHLQAFYFEGII